MRRLQLATLAVLLLVAEYSVAEFTPEFATTEVLPEHDGQQWFWVYGFRAPNQGDSRAFLIDEKGHQLGQLNMGFWAQTVINAPKRGAVITLETYFSRGTRGERTDVVVLYDERTLAPAREVIIPPKRLNAVKTRHLAVLSEDERFLLVVNYTPAQSVTIVDLDVGAVVEEVETPGCSVLYTAGPRDFYSICGNGSFLQLKLDDTGHVVARRRSEPLFEAVGDFLTISASRIGDTWYFVSRNNNVYGITMAGDDISLKGKWPLVTAAERAAGWMIAGMEHTTAHQASGRLYVLVQQGEPESFEGPGSAVWVFDTAAMEKSQEIAMDEMTMSIAVSQGDQPRLYTLDLHIPLNSLATFWMALTDGEESIVPLLSQRANIYDAVSGAHLRSSDLLPPGGVLGIKAW
ncbi:MAG: amine dehydrogenase large subunit [Pseudomonadota bacterium]